MGMGEVHLQIMYIQTHVHWVHSHVSLSVYFGPLMYCMFNLYEESSMDQFMTIVFSFAF